MWQKALPDRLLELLVFIKVIQKVDAVWLRAIMLRPFCLAGHSDAAVLLLLRLAGVPRSMPRSGQWHDQRWWGQNLMKKVPGGEELLLLGQEPRWQGAAFFLQRNKIAIVLRLGVVTSLQECCLAPEVSGHRRHRRGAL